MTDSRQFYAGLAPLYHLMFADWEASVLRQARDLDAVIRERWVGCASLLDASCGIGTQALGLAGLGYRVTASDLSPEAVDRARTEADRRGLAIEFRVADMREVAGEQPFDVVIACDNSVPHLPTDDDILAAFRRFHACVRPGGGCVISVRDYALEDLSALQVKLHGVREAEGARWIIWQVWEPHPPHYELAMYFIEDRRDAGCRTHAFRSWYYAIGTDDLIRLMQEAGFADVERLDGRFFQPLIVGTR